MLYRICTVLHVADRLSFSQNILVPPQQIPLTLTHIPLPTNARQLITHTAILEILVTFLYVYEYLLVSVPKGGGAYLLFTKGTERTVLLHDGGIWNTCTLNQSLHRKVDFITKAANNAPVSPLQSRIVTKRLHYFIH